MEKPLDYYSQNKQRFHIRRCDMDKNWIADAYPDAISVLIIIMPANTYMIMPKPIKDDAQRKKKG